ncbi:MAG TPA: L,D-transpeptidase [Xanthobacteraceae bacterium]|jgi:lipoprotein-anchoring transpeptidase ErfK/SrfK
MHRLVVTALAASAFGMGPALADPLPPTSAPPHSRHRLVVQVVQTVQSEAPAGRARTRYAAAGTANLGGGLIEALFGGGPRALDTPQYQPAAPAYGYNPAQSDADPRSVDPRYLPQVVSYDGAEAPGTVIVDTRERLLYLVQAGGRAMRYGIGVGRPGFTWAGVKSISAKREWPDWRPPAEMLKRRPDLPTFMAGGAENPLGARAMYLGSTLYRIHGSNEPWTIGTAVSSGCIRMRNEDVIDLYNRVSVGTKVVVI